MSDLNDTEQGNVRTALRFLRLQVGAWAPLAKQLHTKPGYLGKIAAGNRVVTPTLALRLAKLVEVPFDDLVSGRYLPARPCPRCGYPANQYERDEHTVVEAGRDASNVVALRPRSP